MVRVSFLDQQMGPSIPASYLAEITKRKASHVNLHQNNIRTLCLPRSSAGEASLNHLVALDLSSNSLHDGYVLPRSGAAKGVSLLSLTPNLCKLNLSNNGLTEESFAALIGGCGSRDDAVCLPRLHTLDVSQNAFTKLPLELHVSCPSLRHLDAASNKIKSLSNTVNALHPYRGKLESVDIQTNPVCSKVLCREKIVFVLGSSLTLLDGVAIGPAEREEARLALERGLTNYTAPRSDEPSRRGRAQNATRSVEEPLGWSNEGDIDDEAMHNSHQDDSANEKIRALEEQVAALSSLVATQACSAPAVDANNRSRAAEEIPRSEPPSDDGSMICSQRLAAASLLMMRLQTKKHEQMNLPLAFSLWALSTRLAGQAEKAKAECVELERRWQAKAKALVEKAIANEAAAGKRLLEASEKDNQALRDETERLRAQAKDLERHLDQQKESHERSSEAASDKLQSQMRRMEASTRLDREKHAEHVRAKEAEIDNLRESLHRERREKAKLESDVSQLSIANQQSKEASASQASQLHDLKLEVVQRDTTIQRLKETYSQAARRCSADRTRCEQALAAEADSKEMLREQASKLNAARASLHEMQNDLSTKASLVSRLKSDVEEQQRKMASLERRAKTIAEERDELQQRLAECNRRNSQLNAHIEQAEEDARRAKRHSVDKEQMDAEITRAAELQLSLERLRQRAKRDEAELRSRNEALKDEIERAKQDEAELRTRNESLHRTLQMAKSESRVVAKQLRSAHDVDVQRLDAAERTLQDKEAALTSVKKSLETERALRLDMERRATALEAENTSQKARMQTAIEGLAKQLAGT